MSWETDLQNCLTDIASIIADTVSQGGSPAGIQIIMGESGPTAFCFQIIYGNDFACDICPSYTDILPPNYCEDQPMTCDCSAELAAITAAIETMAVTVGESINTCAANLTAIRDEIVVGNINTGYLISLGALNGINGSAATIATNTGSLPGISTGVGVIATAATFIGTQIDLIEGYQAAQTVSQGAIATAAGAVATEIPALILATEQNALNTGAVASNLVPLQSIYETLVAIEADQFQIAFDTDNISQTLTEIRDCVCNGDEDSSRWYLKLDGPTPTQNAGASAGGAGVDRWFPYAGVTFKPKNPTTGATDNRIGTIYWVTYEKSLVPYPAGGPDAWDAIIVPSLAIEASQITASNVKI